MFILTDEYRKECIVLLEKEISSNEDKKNSVDAELNSGTLSFNEMTQVSEIVKGVQGDVPGILLGNAKLIEITKLFEKFLVDIDYKGIPVSIANVTPDNRVGSLSRNVPITDTVTIIYNKEITAFSGQLYEAELSNNHLSCLQTKLLKGAPGAQCILDEAERDKILELESKYSTVNQDVPATVPPIFQRVGLAEGITLTVNEEEVFVPITNLFRLSTVTCDFIHFPIADFIITMCELHAVELSKIPKLESLLNWLKENTGHLCRTDNSHLNLLVKLAHNSRMRDEFNGDYQQVPYVAYMDHVLLGEEPMTLDGLDVKITGIELDLRHI